jgi:Ser/Thr protein kinase RdoA (MazF antagonist)
VSARSWAEDSRSGASMRGAYLVMQTGGAELERVLPIAEMVALGGRLDEHGHCDVVDAAAGRWSRPGGTFLRSSASHVFLPEGNEPGGVVLRLRPDDARGTAALSRSARAGELLAAHGADIAPAVRSRRGRLLERVPGYVAMASARVHGKVYDDDEVDEELAREWGAALAGLHTSAADVTGLSPPDATSLLELVKARIIDVDPRLAAVLDRTHAELGALPRDSHVYGLLHGDPEIDNLVWTDEGPRFVDLDDVRRGWFVSDVGFALRAWSTPVDGLHLGHPIAAAFIAGYRSRRTLTDESLEWLPLLTRAAELESLGEWQPMLIEDLDPSWPSWAAHLQERVRARAADLVTRLTC